MIRLSGVLPAAILLYGAANAAPHQPQVTKAARQDNTAATVPWVTVGTDGTRTITPVLTTISGTPTVISPAPGNEVTQTFGDLTTTSAAPLPTATATDGTGGAFPECRNHDGPFAPFCLPASGDTLNPGKTYYVTWDASFFPSSNTTLNVLATFVNTTQNAWNKMYYQAGWGFVPLTVDPAAMIQAGQSSSNVTLSLVVQASGGSAGATTLQGPTVMVANPPGPQPGPPAQPPSGLALYIGVPVIGGFILLFVVGTCLWNRKVRQIGLGNIMSRSRNGYGVGKGRTERLAGRRVKAKEAIRLREREIAVPDEQRYRDVPTLAGEPGEGSRGGGGIAGLDAGWHELVPGRNQDTRHDGVGVPRRDSDALGSLAGTPTENRHMDFGRPGRGNAFRDEIGRQQREDF